MREAFDSALENVITFLPKFLAFLAILIIGILIAKAIQKLISKLLERIGFDRVVERGGIKTALAKSQFDASDIVAKIVYYALVLFVLQLAFGVFGPNPISELLTGIIAFLPLLVVAIIIIIVAAAIAAAVKTLIQNTLGGLSYGKALANIASLFILFVGIVAALNQIGIATTVTTPILVTILAVIGGVIVVGAGGGLIKPMQERWERYLSKVEEEAPKIAEQARQAPSIKEQASQAADQARQAYQQNAPTGGSQPLEYTQQYRQGPPPGYSEQRPGYQEGPPQGYQQGGYPPPPYQPPPGGQQGGPAGGPTTGPQGPYRPGQ